MEMNWPSSSVCGTLSESEGGVLETQGSLPSQCTHDSDSQCSGSLCVASFHRRVILGASGQCLHFPESKGGGTEGPPLTRGRAGWSVTPGPSDSYFLQPLLRRHSWATLSERVPSTTLFPERALLFFLALRDVFISCLSLPPEYWAKGMPVDEPSSAGGIVHTARNHWI